MILQSLHEIVGTVTDVICEDGQTRVLFSIQKEIEIPEGALPIGELKDLVGRRIGIINVQGEYRIRTVRG